MQFEWDPRKAVSNKIKHGVSFEEAITAFDDPMALRAPDTRHSTQSEQRHWLIGETDEERVVVVVFTERERGDVCRIISTRRASRKERRTYEEIKRVSL